MKLLSFLILTTLLTMAGCSSEAAPDAAYHCIDDGVTCSCQQGKVPAGHGNEIDACVPQPTDCCAFVEYQQGGAACECLHDPTNPGLGFSSCSSYQASTYAKVSYQQRSTCP
jgi:hypothetical protein